MYFHIEGVELKAKYMVDAISRTGVSKTITPLIVELDRMGIYFCCAGIARQETQMIIQSSLLECVREAQQRDCLLQEVRKIFFEG